MVAAGLLAFGDLAQQEQHVIGQERLLQKGQARVCNEGLDLGSQRITRDETQSLDHLRSPSLQSLIESQAVERRHSEVAKNDIVVMLQRHFEASPAIGRRVDAMTLPKEYLSQRVEDLRLVLDDQNSQAPRGLPLNLLCSNGRCHWLRWKLDRECRAATRSV